MKTLYTLSTIVLIALSLNSSADDKLKSKGKSTNVAVAPFVWGEPLAEVPAELSSIKAKNSRVPVAPFVWGNLEETDLTEGKLELIVPVAPFIFGDSDSDAPVGLEFNKAVNADVPVAPFVWGSVEDVAPVI